MQSRASTSSEKQEDERVMLRIDLAKVLAWSGLRLEFDLRSQRGAEAKLTR